MTVTSRVSTIVICSVTGRLMNRVSVSVDVWFRAHGKRICSVSVCVTISWFTSVVVLMHSVWVEVTVWCCVTGTSICSVLVSVYVVVSCLVFDIVVQYVSVIRSLGPSTVKKLTLSVTAECGLPIHGRRVCSSLTVVSKIGSASVPEEFPCSLSPKYWAGPEGITGSDSFNWKA